MTSLDAIFQLDPRALELLCLSVLHYGLRMFSFLMKLGYHQTFKVKDKSKFNDDSIQIFFQTYFSSTQPSLKNLLMSMRPIKKKFKRLFWRRKILELTW